MYGRFFDIVNPYKKNARFFHNTRTGRQFKLRTFEAIAKVQI